MPGSAAPATLAAPAAWVAVLAYTMQIYFDFSGYTDMALGAARMFNIRMPINFDSPYRATDIRDFWHRWHITLSRFLREYLYIPLGGNRGGDVADRRERARDVPAGRPVARRRVDVRDLGTRCTALAMVVCRAWGTLAASRCRARSRGRSRSCS